MPFHGFNNVFQNYIQNSDDRMRLKIRDRNHATKSTCAIFQRVELDFFDLKLLITLETVIRQVPAVCSSSIWFCKNRPCSALSHFLQSKSVAQQPTLLWLDYILKGHAMTRNYHDDSSKLLSKKGLPMKWWCIFKKNKDTGKLLRDREILGLKGLKKHLLEISTTWAVVSH